jgi:hypothetical protein
MSLKKTAHSRTARVACLACLCSIALLSSPLLGDGVTLDKPVRLGTTKSDKSKLAGRVASFDEQGFELLDDKDKAKTVAWSELPARNAYDVFDRLLAKGTGEQWLTAGRVLYHLPDGKPQGEKAFARALRLDPKLKDQVEKAKPTPPVDPSAPPAGGKELLGEPGQVAGRDAVMKKFWAPETPEERAASVKELKEFAEKTAKVKDGSLKLLETEYFLFYTDLKPAEAEKWRGLLDKMYARLAELFGVEKGRNIWRGKAMVFVFSKQDDYRKFELETYGNVLTENSGGKCHGRGNGFVHIVFFRQPKESGFAQVLVHEATHGFVHRYRSHVSVPSWVNEGLADVMATELVPDPARVPARRVRALDSMRQYKGVGDDFFTVNGIAGWQYPIAENLSAFMIQQNKKGYVAFINALKDGLSMDEALEQKYGVNKERILQAFLDHMGVKLKK